MIRFGANRGETRLTEIIRKPELLLVVWPTSPAPSTYCLIHCRLKIVSEKKVGGEDARVTQRRADGCDRDVLEACGSCRETTALDISGRLIG